MDNCVTLNLSSMSDVVTNHMIRKKVEIKLYSHSSIPPKIRAHCWDGWAPLATDGPTS